MTGLDGLSERVRTFCAHIAAAATGLASQLDPQSMIDAFVRIAEEDASKFRNVVPDETAEWIKGLQATTWNAGKDDAIWSSPPTG